MSSEPPVGSQEAHEGPERPEGKQQEQQADGSETGQAQPTEPSETTDEPGVVGSGSAQQKPGMVGSVEGTESQAAARDELTPLPAPG